MTVAFIKIGWCLPDKIEEFKGLTRGSILKKKERGELIEGVHWKKFQGRVLFNYERFDEYIENDGRAA